MTREEMLEIMRLLSALEAVGLMRDSSMPDYLLEKLDTAVKVLEREILKETK
jgi:hypothetical protein